MTTAFNILHQLPALLTAFQHGAAEHAGAYPVAEPVDGYGWAGLILWLPVLSLVLCGACAALRVRSRLPAWITVGCLGAAFAVTLKLYLGYTHAIVIPLFEWINLSWESAISSDNPTGNFIANFALYVDSLTLLWMLFVTGLGTLIALYASEYMEPDVGKGYARFFAGVSVFLFAMSCLVMGNNLLMLYLGWEGVGFASYWLIGYYYQKPSAVAAAKKAFIVNRIGDLGLALGLYLIYHYTGSVQYTDIFAKLGGGPAQGEIVSGGWALKAIPFLLMLGAFGKSAQFPLYVWLPDAMEGPTPVSALIHAATMVTAGVYLLARMSPVMQLNEYALPTVAWIGGFTAILAATIGMAQYDIKRIMAYSTVSQLGYMFVGVGVMTTFGAAYHVFTHAFFKAVLFLTCGAIMHGFAGQLDLRKISGLRHMTGWKTVAYTMLIGCLCLSGFPFTSGFFSKDAIIAQTFVNHDFHFDWLGWLMLFTAGLTAYYTFRVWFRVCAGPASFEMGDEHHGAEQDDAHHHDGHNDAHAGHGHAAHSDHGHDKPHAPRLAINLVLVVIAVGAILAAIPYFMHSGQEGLHGGWVAGMVYDSSARAGLTIGEHEIAHEGGGILGMDPHAVMYYVSGVIGLIGIAIAAYFHLFNRKAADALHASLLANPATRWLPIAMENKWYVDEMYHLFIRAPLWIIGNILYMFDRYIIDMLIVDGVASLPRGLGKSFQPLANGALQSYAVSMAGGVGLVAILILFMPDLIKLINGIVGGAG